MDDFDDLDHLRNQDPAELELTSINEFDGVGGQLSDAVAGGVQKFR